MTFGILVEPPTKTTSKISFLPIPESLSTYSTGGIHYLNKGKQSSSNLALIINKQLYDISMIFKTKI
jgi:hypothetical protein